MRINPWFTITEHGKPVVRLIPATAIKPKPDIHASVVAMKEFHKGVTLGGLSIREVIVEGRLHEKHEQKQIFFNL